MVLDRSNNGTVGSNPAPGVDDSSALCVRRGLAIGRSPVQGVLLVMSQKDSQFQKLILNWNRPGGLTRGMYNKSFITYYQFV
jgi:hypothetical protein